MTDTALPLLRQWLDRLWTLTWAGTMLFAGLLWFGKVDAAVFADLTGKLIIAFGSVQAISRIAEGIVAALQARGKTDGTQG